MQNRTAIYLAAASFIAGTVAGTGLTLHFNRASAPEATHDIILNKGETFSGPVSAVHDGDTITVENGPRSYHVRIWGEDAYELKQTCRPHGQEIACGKMAQERVRTLIGGRDVSCTVMGKEPYGRVLAQCFTAAKTDIARTLIREGLAMEYQSGGIYTADENYAGSHGKGLWDSDEPPQTPKEWRACHHIGRSRPAPEAVCP